MFIYNFSFQYPRWEAISPEACVPVLRLRTDCLLFTLKAAHSSRLLPQPQAGRRLGFTVEDGRYRGQAGHIGYDGIWRFPDGHAVIIEVKTTDAYRIDLDTIAGYRRALIRQGSVQEQSSSMLIVVGREDTGDLEAQIRGSRHAWDMRLISVDSLMRLMVLKEEVEEPRTIRRIYDILIPREFTKLDSIVEIIFSTAEEVKHEEQPTEVEDILEEVRSIYSSL